MRDRTTFIQEILTDGIEIDSNLEQAFLQAEFTNNNLFITGKAGTGKSVFVNKFVKFSNKSVVVLAPTGVAAVNVQGQTIHSFFQLATGMLTEVHASSALRKMWNTFDTLIIDEISMVRVDLFSAVNQCMQQVGDHEKPFGGKQIILIGDIYQLPPVVIKDELSVLLDLYPSRWWFDSPNIGNFSVIELDKVYRQKDVNFISVLNNLREGSHSKQDIDFINDNTRMNTLSSSVVTITTTNAKAELINTTKLTQIKAKEHVFYGSVTGTFPDGCKIAPQILKLKVGARAMILRNHLKDGIYNGAIVTVTDITDNAVIVVDKNKREHIINRESWFHYVYKVNQGVLEKTIDGTYIQYPLKLAWGLTAHKVQGITFDEAIIDFDRGIFECGQAYVALSRVQTLGGIQLIKPIKHTDFKVDKDVQRFFAGSRISA